MLRAVNIRKDSQSGITKVSSRPAGSSILLFLIGGIGLLALPTTEYRHDYFAYFSLLFMMGLTAYYFVMSIQVVVFDNQANIRVRHGFRVWNIPLETIEGGYTTYGEKVSRQSLAKTHFLNLELQVNLPDDPKHRIRKGTANVFHYGFSYWGKEQEKIWRKLNTILDEKGIPNLTKEPPSA